MLGKNFPEEDLDKVTEDDGVKHLHHCGFHVQGHRRPLLITVLDFLLKESTENSSVNLCSIDNLAGLQRKTLLENLCSSITLVEGDLNRANSRHDVALLTAEEIPVSHRSDTASLSILFPWYHCLGPLGKLLGILLHSRSAMTIRVSLTRNTKYKAGFKIIYLPSLSTGLPAAATIGCSGISLVVSDLCFFLCALSLYFLSNPISHTSQVK